MELFLQGLESHSLISKTTNENKNKNEKNKIKTKQEKNKFITKNNFNGNLFTSAKELSHDRRPLSLQSMAGNVLLG